MTTIDIAAIRADTPACEERIHFHNSGTSLPATTVVDTMIEYLRLEARIGGYEAVMQRAADIKAVYTSIAQYIGAEADNIALTESATVSWSRAFSGVCQRLERGDRILTGRSEYASNYIAFLQAARLFGVDIGVVEDDEHGQIDCARLAQMLDKRVKLVAITHMPTNGGLVNPVERVGELCRQVGVVYLLDACQSVGQVPIDIDAIGCDFLSATGRKFLRGPRGSGFLYVSPRALERFEPFPLDLYSASWSENDAYEVCETARRYELFESSVAARLGLGRAVDYAMAIGQEAIWQRIQHLASYLRGGLSTVPGVRIQDKGAVKSGIVSFTCDGLDPDRVQPILREKGINCGTSSIESTRLDMGHREQYHFFRPSVHYFNTEEEIDRFVDVMRTLSPACVSLPMT